MISSELRVFGDQSFHLNMVFLSRLSANRKPSASATGLVLRSIGVVSKAREHTVLVQAHCPSRMLAHYFQIKEAELKTKAVSDPRAAAAADVASLRGDSGVAERVAYIRRRL
jgi:hypothetical protein